MTGGSGATTPAYTTPGLTTATYYRAIVSNGVCPGVTSNTAEVTIQTSPTVTINGPENCVDMDSAFVLSATITGYPAPALQWYLQGQAIAGATNSTYSVLSASGNDYGDYKLTAINVCSSDSADFNVAECYKTRLTPKITWYPVCGGNNGTLYAGINTFEPGITYLWSDGSTADSIVVNNNNTYCVTITVPDNGVYSIAEFTCFF